MPVLQMCIRDSVKVQDLRASTSAVSFTEGKDRIIELIPTLDANKMCIRDRIDTIRLDALKDRLHLLVEKRFRGEIGRAHV